MIRKRRVFIDMDGTTVDFDRLARERGVLPMDLKHTPGAFLQMQPMPGAIEAVRTLIAAGFEIWIATKPPTRNFSAYAEKAQWVFEYLPELTGRFICTPDKSLLGDEHDVLIDDMPHKSNAEKFRGTLVRFYPMTGWPMVLELLGKTTPEVDPPEPAIEDEFEDEDEFANSQF